MYVGVLGMLAGEALLFQSSRLAIYAAGIAVMFHLRVVVFEEPVLARTFGEEFQRYRERVPRWVGRVRSR
jgi:protein-S-isoprenylcysteine O-methyltransferase Ste14